MMSRHWVICMHGEGAAHLELNHVEGTHHDHDFGCDCHDHDHDRDHDGDGSDDVSHPHDHCSHLELLVEVGPEQQPDSTNLPLQPAFEVTVGSHNELPWRIASQQTRSPPATGPPRPRRFLAVRATTVLLI